MTTVQPGSQLGPYQILSPIGAGGMGEVWRARDTRLNRIVAIKVSNEKFSERVEREARAVAALNHPHICTLYDVGPNYLVMEYIEGRPLTGPLPMAETLKYAGQICDALHAAHRKGIVHRDLKPGNILLTKSGVKLLDFGLAKMSADPDGAPTAPVTQDGLLIGTLQYMSPEQLEGKKADARSDIYSLGLVLYEMLTGQRPSPHGEFQRIEESALEGVVKVRLAKDPDARWQSVHDVKVALEWSGENRVKPATTKSKTSFLHRRVAWILAITFLGISLVFAGLYWAARSAPAAGEMVRLAVNPPDKTVFWSSITATVPAAQFAVSPDGRSIVFAAATAGRRQVLWVRSLEDTTARPLSGTEDAQNPFWSPDNLWVGFFAEGKLKKIPAAGGTAQVIAGNITDPRGGSWGHDETVLFADGSTPISRVPSGGGTPTRITQLDPARREASHRWPYFLPDGQHFLYTVRSALSDHLGVYVGSLDGKTKKLLVPLDTSAVYAASGYILFVDRGALLGQKFDSGTLDLTGQPFPIAEQVGRSSMGQAAISVSASNTLAYAGAVSQVGRLVWFDRVGNRSDTSIPEGDYSDFRFSPDGRRLAASLVDPKTADVDIWITDLERGGSSRFTHGPRVNSSAIWSPDGAQLIFRTNRGGLVDIYQKGAAGGSEEQPVLSWDALKGAGAGTVTLITSDWSRNGDVVFAVPMIATGWDLWFFRPDGDRKPVKFIDLASDQLHANFSPDGRLLAYSSNDSGRFEVHVQTFPRLDSKWQISTNGGYEPRWRDDGHEIYYLSEDRKLMAVSVGPGPSFGVPKPLFQTQVPADVSAYRTHYVPSLDGSRFLVNTQSDPALSPITIVLNWTAGLKK
jgi:Tol biopolymer transport system component